MCSCGRDDVFRIGGDNMYPYIRPRGFVGGITCVHIGVLWGGITCIHIQVCSTVQWTMMNVGTFSCE